MENDRALMAGFPEPERNNIHAERGGCEGDVVSFPVQDSLPGALNYSDGIEQKNAGEARANGSLREKQAAAGCDQRFCGDRDEQIRLKAAQPDGFEEDEIAATNGLSR